MKPEKSGVAKSNASGFELPLGQRTSRQRDAILGIIAGAKGPLSIPEIYERVRQEQPRLGIATIYRTLKLAQQNGHIESVVLPSGELRFEPTGKGHREHFQCRGCREVWTLSICPLILPRHSVLQGGFVVEDHELTIYGTCPFCASA